MSNIDDLFVVRKGGGRQYLKANKRYVVTRQGAVVELDTSDPSYAAQAENQEALLLLGDKGDLRQLETIYRNLTVLFNGSVRKEEMYHIEAGAISSVNAPNGSYDATGLAYLKSVRFKSTANTTVNYVVQGSNDDHTWHDIFEGSVTVPESESASDEGSVELIAPQGIAKFRYFRASAQAGEDFREIVFVVEEIAKSKFLPLDEAGKLQELNSETYDVTFFVQGAPDLSTKLLTFVVPRELYIRNNWGGFIGFADTPPAAPYPIKVLINDVEKGTFTVDPNGTTSMSSLTRTKLVPGDRVSLLTPAYVDATMADLSLTLVFDRQELA
ncbi:hypothetical protein J8Z24_21710 (plasmid) [Pseudoalteromonas sp. SCSIO 43201]|uniref:hypothetical protein n=1 Tax=Pseudoalteromonas sp. SCSIO 43201 TaxID=2822842 RepID=UPI0020757C7E|nr:hypothetical protein [Pseudoalteromonas sp. SCSIO 43201]USD31129.1 hypothetical protein J8Z24_21710 [Pseudoalteromonas sp. SCSIO 43201]